MKFYERFESLMKERGLTVAEVSRATGIPYTTLDSYVKKKQNYTSMENVIKLAEYFGVTMEWMATGKEIAKDGMTLELSPLKRKVLDQITELDEEKINIPEAFLSSIKKIK